MKNIKANVCVYREYANKELAKILNRVLSLYSHMPAYTFAHVHSHTHASYTCVTHRGLICHHVAPSFSSAPHQLPSKHVIKIIFLLNLIQNNSNEIHKKFRKIPKNP